MCDFSKSSNTFRILQTPSSTHELWCLEVNSHSNMHPDYEKLPLDEFEEQASRSSKRKRLPRICPYIIGTYSILASLVLLYIFIRPQLFSSESVIECEQPQFRREWRTLDDREKRSYIQAVQCLRDVPSSMGTNYSLSEDFAYIHAMGSGISTFNEKITCIA
jgi:hypothetical protein